jgi:ribosome-binding protein aMBF1 (putative translation factor)
MTCEICHREAITREIEGVAVCRECVSAATWERRSTQYPIETERRKAAHDRDWYQENDPQSLADSINAANAGNPRKP